MRIGIAGSSGFIGTALTVALRRRGDQVTRFVRPGARVSDGDIRWNPERDEIDSSDVARVGALDAIVNLAGAGIGGRRWSDARRRVLRTSRLRGTHLLSSSLDLLGAPHFVSGSAIGFYGLHADEPVDESAAPGDDFLARLCVDWEAAATASGGAVALLRTGIVLDRSGGALKRQLPLFRLGVGGRLGSGAQWMSLLSLRDTVEAIVWILDHRLQGPFNVCAPEAVTNRQFTSALARQLGRPALMSVPRPALSLALGKGLVDGALLASQRGRPRRLLESGYDFRDPDLTSMVARALGESEFT